MEDRESKGTDTGKRIGKPYKANQSQLLSLLYGKGYLHGITGMPNILLILGERERELDVVYNSGYCDGAMDRICEDYSACAVGTA